MINAKVFEQIFGIYATELWAMSESDFLEWLNAKHIATESRPKGKWIYTHGDYFKVRCGVCGFANQCEDNFCPKCGADMRGDK